MSQLTRRPLLFRLALRRAIKVGLRDGTINEAEAYLLNEAVRRPRRKVNGKPINLMEQAEQTAKKQLYEAEGPDAFANGEGIDWAYWIDLLVTWLPVIIKTILLLLVFLKADDEE